MAEQWGTWQRLFRLDLRRSTAWWLLPLVAGWVWLLVPRGGVNDEVVTWLRFSAGAGWAACMAAPLVAAVAAWLAGRDRRCGLDDLLITTPTGLLPQTGTRVLAVVLLGITGWAVSVSAVVAQVHPWPTWGAPRLDFILPGLAMLCAVTMAGYSVGLVTHARMVPPLLLCVGIAPIVVLGGTESPALARFLPLAYLEPQRVNVFHEYSARPGLAMLLVWIGVGLLVLALVVGWRERARAGQPGGVLRLGMVGLALLLPGIGLLAAPVPAQGHEPVAEWQPICRQASVPFCVHPAYAALLPALIASLDPVLHPVAGMPDAPQRVIQASENRFGLGTDGTLAVPSELWLESLPDLTALYVTTDTTRTTPQQQAGIAAQIAVAKGLALLSGVPLDGRWFPHALIDDATLLNARMPLIDAAAQRFAALDDATRRDWLQTHLAALRAGDVTLEDLP